MSTELDHLRALRATDDTPDASARDAARAALLERIELAGAAGPGFAPRRARALRRARSRRLAVLAAGGAAALAVALTVGLGTDGVQPEQAPAAQLLQRAADVAAGGGDLALAPGQYFYVRMDDRQPVRWADAQPLVVRLRLRTELWTAADGSGRVRYASIGRPQFLSRGGRAAWIARGRPALTFAHDSAVPRQLFTLGGEKLTYAQVRALPTDVDALAARVERAAHPGAGPHRASAVPTEALFATATTPLLLWPLPAALRAAFYRVAARIPGIVKIAHAHDATGRACVGVGLTRHGMRVVLLFDPHTAAVLGWRVQTGGRITADRTFTYGVVDSARARP